MLFARRHRGRSVARAAKGWFETFFGADYLTLYEHTSTPTEVESLEKILHLRSGARVLDLACGAGRHAIELAKRGYEVVGYDLSEPLLKVARKGARAAKVEPTFVQGDMRRLRFSGEFDAVINMFTSFGYFDTVEEDRKVLAGIAKALKPRGKLLMERFNRELLPQQLPAQAWYVRDKNTVVLAEESFDLLKGRFETRQLIIDGKGTREYSGSVRAYTLAELKEMFDVQGLFLHRVLGGLDLSPYTAKSRRLVLYAVKGLEPEGIRTVW
jgi:SAM-dependent methyltransferase